LEYFRDLKLSLWTNVVTNCPYCVNAKLTVLHLQALRPGCTGSLGPTDLSQSDCITYNNNSESLSKKCR